MKNIKNITDEIKNPGDEIKHRINKGNILIPGLDYEIEDLTETSRKG